MILDKKSKELIALRQRWLAIKSKAEKTQQFGMLHKAELELEAIDNALAEK